MQSLAQHCSESCKNDKKIPRRNYITKLIQRTPFCRIPSVERSKWDLIFFHHHFIIVTSYITVNKNLPQCRLNRQPNAAQTGCPPPPPRLKGKVSRDFLLLVFLRISFPPALEYSIRTVTYFLKIRGDIHKSRCTTGINDTGGKFFHQFR